MLTLRTRSSPLGAARQSVAKVPGLLEGVLDIFDATHARVLAGLEIQSYWNKVASHPYANLHRVQAAMRVLVADGKARKVPGGWEIVR